MDYTTNIRRTLVSFFHFFAVATWALFIYYKVWDFVKAAIALKYVNVQIISYTIYSFLLVLFPISFIYKSRKSKRKHFSRIGYLIAAIIAIGATGDLITYHFFINYTFVEGDAIFCNILLSVPNLYGVLLCYLLAAAYVMFGTKLTNHRYTAVFFYFLIFIIGIVPAFVYSYMSWGGYPRATWIEKAAFIMPHQLAILLSFLIGISSDLIWKERIR